LTFLKSDYFFDKIKKYVADLIAGSVWLFLDCVGVGVFKRYFVLARNELQILDRSLLIGIIFIQKAVQ
jgi:hypothetical protein